jgi:CheY-like chemotaxis protein
MDQTRISPLVSTAKPLSFHSDGGYPRILVVDDESAIADTLTEILSRSGYPAIAAYDGNGALELALLSPPELLITDVVLPGMNGIELALTLKRVYPDCKILLFSGQATTADLLTRAQCAGHSFTLLSKPVPPKDLLALVADRLGSKRTSAALPQA